VHTDPGFLERMAGIERLVERIEQWPDSNAQEEARALVSALLELHGAGLTRVVEALGAAGDPGRSVLESLARDELVSSLLVLHGLHPESLEMRVRRALDSVRPRLEAHGGDVELIEIADGTVRLRMLGSCHGCPSSEQTLRSTIEEAVRAAAPDVTAIAVDGAVPAPAAPAGAAGFIPVDQLVSAGCRSAVDGDHPTSGDRSAVALLRGRE
jgi:Fe-S cluster biogenesis protein NfuA